VIPDEDRTDERRAEIARRVADGAPITWDHDGKDATLRHLHWIERIGSAYRDSSNAMAPITAPDDDAPTPEPDFVWGPLDGFEAIGRGASGTVFRAVDRKLERTVALKLFDSTAADVLEEARRLARVRHPNLLTVYDTDVHDGRAGLWTEWIVGMDLEEELRRRGCWSPDEALAAADVICGALAVLHEAGLAHGDLTARNVLRERGGRLVVADLGASTDTLDGPIGVLRTGTPLALPPECLDGKPTGPRDDLYSLGVLLYRMLTDRHPVEAESLDELRHLHTRDGPTPVRSHRPTLPADLAAVVDRAVDRDPGRRFPTAAALRSALPSARPRPPRHDPRRTAVLGLAAAAIALALFVGVRPGTTPGEAPAPVLLASYDAVFGEVGPMQEIREGERLHLEWDLDAPSYVYVLNEDARGDVHVLFPLDVLDTTNPLPAGEHRLPGTIGSRGFGWQVTRAGGEEHVLVLRSAEPLTELESTLARIPDASRDAATIAASEVGPRLRATLRSMAGLAPSTPDDRAGTFLRDLVENHRLGETDGIETHLLRFVSVR